ncbi:MAG TPA: class A beta-lactamase [Chthoniobacterales bacterium]|nr:class A beta-lactamase [Chthoniobacterales bacterium]
MMYRSLLAGLVVVTLSARAEAGGGFAALEAAHGGRLGVAALDTGNGQRVGYRADERFAMCSTFKLLLAAAVLARVDAGEESLDRKVTYREADLLSYAPITRKHLPAMTVGELCAAAIQYSDNTAANLLLRTLGGPKGLTHYLRSSGDKVTRLDRIEPELNSNLPGDERDTTTPAAVVGTMRRLLVGKALSKASSAQLNLWLVGNTTGDKRLRAGVAPAWKVGDKTGTGGLGAANDVAIVWPKEGSAPWLVAVFYSPRRRSR